MKNQIKYISFIILSIALFSCNQEDKVTFYEDGKAPVITGIADGVANEKADSLEIGTVVRVGGEYFNLIEKVSVNETEISMSQVTVLRNVLYFTMPRVPRASENYLILESKFGEIKYPISLKYPPFQITGIYNEYTPKGQKITVLGESMDLYATVGVSKLIFTNNETGVSAESYITDVTETSVQAIVPDNAPDKATVTFYSPESGSTVCPVKYRDCEFLIENFEDGNPTTRYPDWVVPNTMYPAPLDPEPTEGEKYCHVYKISTTSGTTLNFAGNYNVIIPDSFYTNADNYDLKFEMFTIEPIKYRIAVSLNWGTTWVAFGPATQTADETSWLTTGGQWKTYSISMSSWKNKTGDKKLRLWNTLPANLLYDVCFDNFRIQRKSN